jgi:hypothetical protein
VSGKAKCQRTAIKEGLGFGRTHPADTGRPRLATGGLDTDPDRRLVNSHMAALVVGRRELVNFLVIDVGTSAPTVAVLELAALAGPVLVEAKVLEIGEVRVVALALAWRERVAVGRVRQVGEAGDRVTRLGRLLLTSPVGARGFGERDDVEVGKLVVEVAAVGTLVEAEPDLKLLARDAALLVVLGAPAAVFLFLALARLFLGLGLVPGPRLGCLGLLIGQSAILLGLCASGLVSDRLQPGGLSQTVRLGLGDAMLDPGDLIGMRCDSEVDPLLMPVLRCQRDEEVSALHKPAASPAREARTFSSASNHSSIRPWRSTRRADQASTAAPTSAAFSSFSRSESYIDGWLSAIALAAAAADARGFLRVVGAVDDAGDGAAYACEEADAPRERLLDATGAGGAADVDGPFEARDLRGAGAAFSP